jgi:anaerobic glycerol-3-phosphate dehydrogenase
VLATSPSTGAVPSGFNWTDAGIGAGVALGVAVFASAGALALRKRVSLAH